MEGEVVMKAIYIYPIKSCRGISLDQGPITSTGFRWDRYWTVVNSKGRMITQRVEPKLALVETFLPFEALTADWGSLPPDAALSVRAPGMEMLQVPLVGGKNQSRVGNISVWEWTGAALDEGPDAADWFSRYLGKPCQLVRYDSDTTSRATQTHSEGGYITSFSDGYPFLLISQASLDALNEKLESPLPINRFRPNIFVEGCKAFAEDLWSSFSISGLTFKGVKLCSRCKITTIEQETGKIGSEPLKIFQTFRSAQALSIPRQARGKVYFGQNVLCTNTLALVEGSYPVVSIGDKVNVLEIASSITEMIVEIMV